MGETSNRLASWVDGPTRDAIEAFVEQVTSEGPGFVPVDERVAVFDNDGTLWCENPMPIQLDFTLRRFAEMAANDVALRDQQPWKAAFEKDYAWLAAAMVKHYEGDDGDMRLLMGAVPRAFEGLSVEDYSQKVSDFFTDATHPSLGRAYLGCGYQPMIELLHFLEANGFTTYIASGGDRDFMRPIAGHLYGITPERVIGSSAGLDYAETQDGTDVLYKSEMEFFNDGPVKPVRIWSRIGRRPILPPRTRMVTFPCCGSRGAPARPSLRLLVLHDDAEREFDYISGAEVALARAQEKGWTVVSIKDDWLSVFADA